MEDGDEETDGGQDAGGQPQDGPLRDQGEHQEDGGRVHEPPLDPAETARGVVRPLGQVQRADRCGDGHGGGELDGDGADGGPQAQAVAGGVGEHRRHRGQQCDDGQHGQKKGDRVYAHSPPAYASGTKPERKTGVGGEGDGLGPAPALGSTQQQPPPRTPPSGPSPGAISLMRRPAGRSDHAISLCLLGYVALTGLQIPVGASSRLAPGDLVLLAAAGLAFSSKRLQQPSAALPWLALPVLLSYGLLVSLLLNRPITQYVLVSKLLGGFSLAIAGFLFQGFVGRIGTRRICSAYFWGAMAVNTVGFLEFQFGVLRARGFVYDSSQIGRFSGLAVDSNANAALLATAGLCGVHLVMGLERRDGLLRLTTMAAVAWCGYLFLISYSRGALVAAVAMSMAAYWYRVRTGQSQPPRPGQIAVATLAAIGLYLRPPTGLLLGGRTDLRSVDARFDLLDRAIELLQQGDLFWLSGIGLGTFQAVHRQVIHSTPAWLYVEFGVLGALYLLGFGAITVTWVGQSLRRRTVGGELWVAILVTYGVMALSIEALYQRPLWIALGCLAGLRRTEPGVGPEDADEPRTETGQVGPARRPAQAGGEVQPVPSMASTS